MSLFIKNISKHFLRQLGETKRILFHNPRAKISLFIFLGLSLVYITSKVSEKKKVVYRDHQSPVFKEGRILGSQTSSYLKSKEAQLGKTAQKIMAENKALSRRLKLLEKRMEAKS